MQKTERIGLRCSPEELTAITARADAAGMSVSSYMIAAALGATLTADTITATRAALAQLSAQLDAIATQS